MTRVVLLIVGLSFLAEPSSASDRDDLVELLSMLPAPEGRSWQFTEVRDSGLFEEPVVVQGTLSVTETGGLIKELTSPVSEKMIIEADQFTIITPRKTYQTSLAKNPSLEVFSIGLIGLLRRDADSILQYFDVHVESKAEDWRLTLEPADKSLRKRLSKLEIHGCDGQVGVVKTSLARGEHQEMRIKGGYEACAAR